MAEREVAGEGIGPLERGRSAYQRKEYTSALASFSEAVEISTGNLLLTALDHRAAAYEKLDKLQAALRDSKQMIDLKPDLSKGYLRCAKVLQLKGENELALKIYERGLNKVKIGTDNDRTKLQSLYTKLRQAQNPGKSLDPLQFLPLELAQMVIENLRMQDRVVCLAVTKSWKLLLESSHKLWTTFDTRYTRKSVSLTSLKLHLKRSNYTLNKAIISMKAKFDITRMQYLTRTCAKLEYLEICGSGVIGDSLTSAMPFAKNLRTIICGTNCEISLAAVQSILESCRNTLVEATFLRIKLTGLRPYFKWPKLQFLRILNLRSPVEILLDLAEFCAKAPNIQSLTLNDGIHNYGHLPIDLSSLKHMKSLNLSNTPVETLPFFPATLEHMNLSRMRHLNVQPAREDETYELPCLESFDCSGTAISHRLVKAMTLQSIKAGKLKKLCLGDRLTEFLPGTPVEDEYPPSTSVRELSLASLIIREGRILEIIKLYPNLERLDVSGTKITGVAVKQLVQMGIKWLNLNECGEVSPDAVEYARGKGIDVQFNFPSRGGRMASFRNASFI